MKRIFIPTLFLCLLSLSDAKGQDTLVDKQPQNRAALLEEFTGVNCGYCPAGHVLTNQLMAEHEGRLFVFNLHAPNSNLVTPPSGTADMRTEYGDALATNAGVNTLPLGTVNRHSFNGSLSLGREQWASAIGQVLEMPAYLNVGARATLDWASRELSVEVQLYYTGEAAVEENHIHVALVQNNIQGYQKNGYRRYQASFAGFFPADDPKYSAIVVLYSGQTKGNFYGATWALPAFREIAEYIYSTSPEWKRELDGSRAAAQDAPSFSKGRADEQRIILSELEIAGKKSAMPAVARGGGWVKITADSSLGLVAENYEIESDSLADVTGMGLKDALYILENQGFKVKFNGYGRVAEQRPAPGSSIKRGATVNLILDSDETE